jgi:hypothetical protein
MMPMGQLMGRNFEAIPDLKLSDMAIKALQDVIRCGVVVFPVKWPLRIENSSHHRHQLLH